MSTAIKPTLIAVAEGASSLDVLAARHRAAWDKTQHGRAEWIEGTLELAAVLADERRKIPADQEWSRWVERNGLAVIKRHDREALIHMARDLTITRKVLEKTERFSWQLIWEKELKQRFPSAREQQPAPAKRKSKTERRTIEQVLNLHRDRGYTFDETAEELGLTKGQVAGIVHRSKSNGPPPTPIKEFTGLKTLTREQVDPDFRGSELEFRTKYGHVPLHTKEQIEENRRLEELATWLAAISDLEIAARTFVKATMPNQNTLDQYLSKPGKAEKLGVRLTMIQAACASVAHYLDLIRSQQKS